MIPFKSALKLFLATLFVHVLSSAGLAFSIQVGSQAYRELERLEVKGLLESGMLSTRPFSRREGFRLLTEAERSQQNLQTSGARTARRLPILRLKEEFAEEYRRAGRYFLKPADGLYLRYLYSASSPVFPNVNNDGDAFREGHNIRGGFGIEAGYSDSFSFFLNPEYRSDSEVSDLTLPHGYIEVRLGGFEMTAGRDSLWWGPGYHGTLLLTNNAKPFDMVKLTSSHPFVLPWVFSRIGLIKPTLFITHLEKDRDFPRASLLGLRVDMKPLPNFQFGLSRVFMFGGKGRKGLSASDWAEVFIASDSAEHGGSDLNGNQIVSLDVSYVYLNNGGPLPFSGIKLYTEWGAEDSSGDTKTPTGRANIYGAFIDEPFWVKDLDLRIEWANTARNERYGPQWYTHGVFTTGYRYKGNFIGHHMGTDARDLFVRAQYHAENSLLELEADFEKTGVHGSDPRKRRWLQAGITGFHGPLSYKLGAGMEFGQSDNIVIWTGISFEL